MNFFKHCFLCWGNVFFFALAFFTGYLAQCQSVAIGGEPNASAVLNITSGSKGLLIPRLTTEQRNNVASPANGLMVYDKDLKCFFYYNGRQNMWVDMKPTPAGMIVMWYGVVSDDFNTDGTGKGRMAGWALCDGQNNRPNLSEKFVMGGNGSNSGTTGGFATHKLDHTTLPSHTHVVSDPGHSHGVTLGGSSHGHSFPYSYSTTHADYARADDGSSITYSGGTDVDHAGTTGPALFNAGITAASAGLSVNATGSGDAHENRPPYYVLAYIIKL